MKPHTINQEILLITTTTFAHKEWCEKDAQSNKVLSINEQLEEACWNGLLDELLPGIIKKSVSGKKLLLWQIIQYNSFLEIDLCELPIEANKRFSINPYLFLPNTSLN